MCVGHGLDRLITVFTWKPFAVGMVGLLLGAGCGWFWQGVVAFADSRCESVIHEPWGELCHYNVVLYYPAGIVVAAMLSFALMAAALAALRIRPWSYAVYATPSVVVFAALGYHLAGVGKILVAAVVLGLGSGCAAAADEFQVRRSSRIPHR